MASEDMHFETEFPPSLVSTVRTLELRGFPTTVTLVIYKVMFPLVGLVANVTSKPLQLACKHTGLKLEFQCQEIFENITFENLVVKLNAIRLYYVTKLGL